jgi:hypothetical protein
VLQKLGSFLFEGWDFSQVWIGKIMEWSFLVFGMGFLGFRVAQLGSN